ncbi:MAG: UDP-glucose/GDP-mannose dehydrogenase family protein [Alphaproteobacteria bacterium]|nr:MAG: UDP-glucose/GDP-mannose dehydrogenase family protein [Alphaproteobacteria bacterium]
MTPRPTVGFAGMTHLGLNSAAAAAARGFATVCYDPDTTLIDRIEVGDLPVVEPDLLETIAKNTDRLTFTADAQRLGECDVIYIAADVPTDDHGESNLAPIERLFATVSAQARTDAAVVILSQVPPGFTRRLAGDGKQLFYQVETLIFGRAVDRALNPERFIVGCADPAHPLPAALHAFLAAFECPILPMRYESAELAKISINCCLVASISVANTLAELSEKIGADWAEIAPALKLDRRIGPHAYLTPGLGIAGGNLERDLATVCRYADAHGTDAGVVRAWIANSRYRKDWALRTVHTTTIAAIKAPVIGILGLAYKENTHSTKNSPAIALIEALRPFALRLHDPVVPASAAPHPNAEGCSDALAVCNGADAVLIMTPWPEYRALEPGQMAQKMRGRVVIDPYAVLDEAACRATGLTYRRLGMMPNES